MRSCEPDDYNEGFVPFLDTGQLYFIMIYKGVTIGYIKTEETDRYIEESDFVERGGIKGKKGITLIGVCGNEDYQGVASPILETIDEYAKNHGYEYILLLAATDRPNLHVGTEGRPGLYKKNGYKIIGSRGPPPGYFIMRKYISPFAVESESGSRIPQLTAEQKIKVCVCVYECNESMATHAQYLLCATSRCRRNGNR